MHSPRGISFLFFVLLLGVSSFLYYPRYVAERGKATQLAAVLSENGDIHSIDARTKSADCVVEGALPDHACTPGAIFPNATPEEVCVPGYTKTVRSVSQKLKKQMYAAYGIPYPQQRGSYEADHLVPLALGGSNDIANLFPEAAEPAPGFREKDLVEVYLHEEVCAGRAVLEIAQKRIAYNWLAVYENLSSDDIKRLKSKYRNWSN